MPINGMNTGRDYSIGLFDANTNSVVDLGDVQSFRATGGKHNISSRPYNGDPKFGYIPDGHSGSFSIVRTGPELESVVRAINTAFVEGGSTLPGFINETIREKDGSFTRYQYIGVVFYLTGVADVARDKTVTQTVEWMASSKKLVA